LEQQKPVVVGGTLAKLQQQNMRLQNEKLAGRSEISDLQKEIKALQTRQYIWWILIVLALIIGYIVGHRGKH
jgi:hypothetical protein